MNIIDKYCLLLKKVVFDFANQIDAELESSLTKMQITVRINGKIQDELVEAVEKNEITTKLNLDVTTMMAFVSNLTCESCDWLFSQPILNEQACRERKISTKLFLDELFQGKITLCNLQIVSMYENCY